MTIMAIDEIKEGMVLEADAKNFSGTTLLKAGSAVTEAHLKAFRVWGITEVAVRGTQTEEVEQDGFDNLDEESRQKIERDLSRIFMKIDLQNPIMAEIYRVMRKRRVSNARNA